MLLTTSLSEKTTSIATTLQISPIKKTTICQNRTCCALAFTEVQIVAPTLTTASQASMLKPNYVTASKQN